MLPCAGMAFGKRMRQLVYSAELRFSTVDLMYHAPFFLKSAGAEYANPGASPAAAGAVGWAGAAPAVAGMRMPSALNASLLASTPISALVISFTAFTMLSWFSSFAPAASTTAKPACRSRVSLASCFWRSVAERISGVSSAFRSCPVAFVTCSSGISLPETMVTNRLRLSAAAPATSCARPRVAASLS